MERPSVYKVARVYFKYRSGQIHLYKFKDHAGITLKEALNKYPWLPRCDSEEDIDRERSLHASRTNI